MTGSSARRGRLQHGLAAALVLSAGASAFAQAGSPEATIRALAKARDERLLLLRAAEFDPLSEAPAIAPELAWSDDERADVDYFIVQLRSKVQAGDHDDLALLGAQELEYLRHNAFLVRLPSAFLPYVQAWPRTRAVVPFHPAYRVAPQLWERAARGELLDVAIILFEGADPAGATLAMRDLGVELPEVDAGTRRKLLARVPGGALVALARIRDVQWVQPRGQPVPHNDTTTWVVQSNASGKTPMWSHGIFGEGVIFGQIDTPMDLSTCWFDDPAHSSPGPNHRKVVSHHGSSSTPDLHGTHTGGILAGDQEPINGVTDGNGIAYLARIAHTNLSLITNNNLDDKLDELYGDGATIFSNSWGVDGTTDYDQLCVDIDNFAWTNHDALVCFSVSNSPVLTNPSNAKNCLAVGATLQAPNQADHCTGGIGPTDDGRRKPEIYAPGCDIFSADDSAACGTTPLSGTSMACPAIAACAALAKEYFEDGFWPTGVADSNDAFTPTGTLLKAILLDSAIDMSGVDDYPNDLEGWGRVVLDRSLYFSGDPRLTWLADVPFFKGFTATGESQTHFIHVTGGGAPLEMCLVFTDKAGAVNSSAPVVNDLDLEALAPDGTVYLGNVFDVDAEESIPGGSFDPLNNVERIRLKAPPTGWWVVTVHATNIATSRKQGYALVATGELDPPQRGGYTAYGAGTAGTGGQVPSLAGVVPPPPSIGDPVAIDVTNGLGGASGLFLIGFTRASLPFAGGELLVSPPWISLPITLGGAAGVAGAGSVTLADTMPADPALVGFLIDFQAIVFDPAGVKGFALSNGLEMEIGS
jgi:hypothetical protein